ncbi:MAG TPA: type II secretion system F family protein [Dermatophilaceae bacterium]|nr:type II secretion system F family protein [Dermatophilaceae bacterium]
MILTAVLLVLGVLLWPSRGGAGAPGLVGDGEGPGSTPSRGRGDTVHAAADALDLCVLAVRAGLGTTEALEEVGARLGGRAGADLLVVAAAQRWGQPPEQAWSQVGPAWRPAALAWQAAERSGAAPAELLRAAADRVRGAEDERIEAAVARAGTLLVLPLGACFLPGFVCTTVVPIVLHLARTVIAG